MHTRDGILKAPLYFGEGEKKKFPLSLKAKILLLNFLPATCHQNKQALRVLTNYLLQK